MTKQNKKNIINKKDLKYITFSNRVDVNKFLSENNIEILHINETTDRYYGYTHILYKEL